MHCYNRRRIMIQQLKLCKHQNNDEYIRYDIKQRIFVLRLSFTNLQMHYQQSLRRSVQNLNKNNNNDNTFTLQNMLSANNNVQHRAVGGA